MSPEIRELDAETVDRIAAGEVVERPASVVKELVENGLDADATEITVEVDAGGIDRIRVADDGIGMTEPEVRKAIEQHTTSKLRDAADLAGGIGTLGFRGEALYTIGAVSRVAITTKSRTESGAGTKLTVAGGEIESVEPVGCPSGTVVEVTDLFYNTPARKEFLKREPTEFDHVNRVVTQYALAEPGVAFALEHDGREVFATTGQGDRRATILAVYGREVARAMVPVEGLAEEEGGGPLDDLAGYVSDPETTRSDASYVSTYVNSRYVRSSTVRNAVLDAYGTQLAPDRYPFAVLDLSVPPGGVDANVHPRKTEVRFGDEDTVADQIEATVERALLDHGLIRTSAPRGRSAPDQAEIESGSEPGDDPSDGSETDPDDTRHERASGPDRPVDDGSSRSDEPTATSPNPSSRGDSPTGGGGGGEGEDRRFDGPTDQRALGEPPNEEFDRLPDLRVLGQLGDTYVVCEADEGLVLIDQHAADERVHYERLKAKFGGDPATQALAEPVELDLTAREAELFDAHEAALADIGFAATREGDRVRVRTVPAAFDATLAPDLLHDVLSEFVAGDPAGTVEATVEELLADLACYPAITGNTSLAEGSVVALLGALDDCENPYACPHGRPVLIRLDEAELEDRFERDYPGHPERRD